MALEHSSTTAVYYLHCILALFLGDVDIFEQEYVVFVRVASLPDVDVWQHCKCYIPYILNGTRMYQKKPLLLDMWISFNGQLITVLLEWNHFVNVPAATNGQCDTLRWLRVNGCPWDEATTEYAKTEEIYLWATQNGCPTENGCLVGENSPRYEW